MSGLLYLGDSYLRECESTVTKVNDLKYVILDQTVFYPKSGGKSTILGS